MSPLVFENSIEKVNQANLFKSTSMNHGLKLLIETMFIDFTILLFIIAWLVTWIVVILFRKKDNESNTGKCQPKLGVLESAAEFQLVERISFVVEQHEQVWNVDNKNDG